VNGIANIMPSLFSLAGPRVSAALNRFFTGRDDGVRGAAAIELAVLAPVLIMAMICTADLGMGIYRSMQVDSAAQAGAEYALTHGFNAAAIANAVTAATALTDVTVSPAPTQFCGCATSTGIAAATCGSSCSAGVAAATYVTASAQAVYQTILPYPLLPSTFTFAAQATVRLQ
jgi:Flp pilus assembly protein TadG